VIVSDLTDDLDLFVVGAEMDPTGVLVCNPLDCLDQSTNGGSSNEDVIFWADAGETYYIAVDGWDGAVSSYTVTLLCI
jgi:hypothetical protein